MAKKTNVQSLTASASAVTISSSVGFLFFVAVARAAKEAELDEDDDGAAAFESGNDDDATVIGEEEEGRRRRNVGASGALLALRHPALCCCEGEEDAEVDIECADVEATPVERIVGGKGRRSLVNSLARFSRLKKGKRKK